MRLTEGLLLIGIWAMCLGVLMELQKIEGQLDRIAAKLIAPEAQK